MSVSGESGGPKRKLRPISADQWRLARIQYESGAAGNQFAAVFQSLLVAFRFQVALPAKATCVMSKNKTGLRRKDAREVRDFIAAVEQKKRCGSKPNRPDAQCVRDSPQPEISS